MEKTEKQVWREVARFLRDCPYGGYPLAADRVSNEADARWPRKLRVVDTPYWEYRYQNGVLQSRQKGFSNWQDSVTNVSQFAAIAALADNPYEDD